jgi:hypothetical protein
MSFTIRKHAQNRPVTDSVDAQIVKRALIVVLLALVAVAPANAARRVTVDRGVVQSISSAQIVLRGLDGSTLSFFIAPRTQVLLNGAPSSVSAIQPGFSAAVTHTAAGKVLIIRAFGKPRAVKQIDKGAIVSVSPTLIVLRQVDGTKVSVSVGPQTSVILDDVAALLVDLRPGYLVAVLHYGAQPAREIRALRR